MTLNQAIKTLNIEGRRLTVPSVRKLTGIKSDTTEAQVVELDPQSRETFNALLAQNRARLSDLLKNEKSGR